MAELLVSFTEDFLATTYRPLIRTPLRQDENRAEARLKGFQKRLPGFSPVRLPGDKLELHTIFTGRSQGRIQGPFREFFPPHQPDGPETIVLSRGRGGMQVI